MTAEHRRFLLCLRVTRLLSVEPFSGSAEVEAGGGGGDTRLCADGLSTGVD